jgi:hypothetical protein
VRCPSFCVAALIASVSECAVVSDVDTFKLRVRQNDLALARDHRSERLLAGGRPESCFLDGHRHEALVIGRRGHSQMSS